jgi:hypothetical protein
MYKLTLRAIGGAPRPFRVLFFWTRPPPEKYLPVEALGQPIKTVFFGVKAAYHPRGCARTARRARAAVASIAALGPLAGDVAVWVARLPAAADSAARLVLRACEAVH